MSGFGSEVRAKSGSNLPSLRLSPDLHVHRVSGFGVRGSGFGPREIREKKDHPSLPQGLGFMVSHLPPLRLPLFGWGYKGEEFRVSGFELRISDFGFRDQVQVCSVPGSGVQGFG